jgi:Papain family cysteine protease
MFRAVFDAEFTLVLETLTTNLPSIPVNYSQCTIIRTEHIYYKPQHFTKLVSLFIMKKTFFPCSFAVFFFVVAVCATLLSTVIMPVADARKFKTREEAVAYMDKARAGILKYHESTEFLPCGTDKLCEDPNFPVCCDTDHDDLGWFTGATCVPLNGKIAGQDFQALRFVKGENENLKLASPELTCFAAGINAPKARVTAGDKADIVRKWEKEFAADVMAASALESFKSESQKSQLAMRSRRQEQWTAEDAKLKSQEPKILERREKRAQFVRAYHNSESKVLNADDKQHDPRVHSTCVFQSILSQGNCDSCWAFATARAIGSAACTASRGHMLVFPSTEQINICGATDAAVPCGGGVPTTAVDYITTYGITASSYYPYSASASPKCMAQGGTGSPKAMARVQHPIARLIALKEGLLKANLLDNHANDDSNARVFKDAYPEFLRSLGEKKTAELTAKRAAIQQLIRQQGAVLGGVSVGKRTASLAGGGHQVVIEGWGHDENDAFFWVIADSRDSSPKYKPWLYWPDDGFFSNGVNHQVAVFDSIWPFDMSKVDASGTTLFGIDHVKATKVTESADTVVAFQFHAPTHRQRSATDRIALYSQPHPQGKLLAHVMVPTESSRGQLKITAKTAQLVGTAAELRYELGMRTDMGSGKIHAAGEFVAVVKVGRPVAAAASASPSQRLLSQSQSATSKKKEVGGRKKEKVV